MQLTVIQAAKKATWPENVPRLMRLAVRVQELVAGALVGTHTVAAENATNVVVEVIWPG